MCYILKEGSQVLYRAIDLELRQVDVQETICLKMRLERWSQIETRALVSF